MSRKLIQEIFSLDKGIRYAAILNHRGAHLEGGIRPGIKSLSPEEDDTKLFLQSTVSKGMSESWVKYFDRLKFSIVAHERITVFQFPFGEGVLLISAEPSVDLSIADRIDRLIEEETERKSKDSLR